MFVFKLVNLQLNCYVYLGCNHLCGQGGGNSNFMYILQEYIFIDIIKGPKIGHTIIKGNMSLVHPNHTIRM